MESKKPRLSYGKRIIYCDNPMDANLFLVCTEEENGDITDILAYAHPDTATAICNMRNEFTSNGKKRNYIIFLHVPFTVTELVAFSKMTYTKENPNDLCYNRVSPVVHGICVPFELCHTQNMAYDFIEELKKEIFSEESKPGTSGFYIQTIKVNK